MLSDEKSAISMLKECFRFLVNSEVYSNSLLYSLRLRNKGVYFKSGLRNMAKSSNSNLEDKIELEVI